VTVPRITLITDSLVARHGERWLAELTATVGQYQYIACVLGAFEVQPEPGKERICMTT
jgi:hypothetical protein